MADLARFVRAQDPVWTDVVAELTLGRKQTHWMWFVFPQLATLGRSEISKFFGMTGVEHAADYYAHPMLGPRLDQVTDLVLRHSHSTAQTIFGGIDAQKFGSSMTLFASIPNAPPRFHSALTTFFGGKHCLLTRGLIQAA